MKLYSPTKPPQLSIAAPKFEGLYFTLASKPSAPSIATLKNIMNIPARIKLLLLLAQMEIQQHQKFYLIF